MPKPAFLTGERISRFLLSFLLALGVLLPLLMLFGLGSQVVMAVLLSAVVLALFSLQSAGAPWNWLVPTIFVVAGILQFLFPGLGFWGGSFEALKAVVLFFSGFDVVMALFGTQVALLLAIGISACAFLFSNKGVGFMPSAIMVVLVLFGMWALGRGDLVWYAMPALCALLLLISQTAHEKISLLNVLPMALAVAVLSLLLLPPGRVTIKPLEEAAFQLKQTITDYLFFTDSRTPFSLGTYGYYPMGGNQLGGEAEPTDYPVMIVQTSRKTLLRGVLKDEYNGRSFRDTSSARRYLYISPLSAGQREKIFLEKYPPEGIRKASTLMDTKSITVQMQNKTASTIFTPVFLRSISPQGDVVPYFTASSELFATRDLEGGDRYTVQTPVFEGGDAGLDALVNAAPKDDAYYAEIYSLYTRLPDHLEQKVYDDLANIIQGASTPYDKAMAILRHLQRYYRYTLSPAEPPENVDFVTYFMYVGKEGYCTYYASAMTVLCRMAGLPSRYVEGFLANPAGDGLAYITGKEAHAWTEVYFEGFGWVPFDPTPPQNEQGEQPPEEPETPPEDEPEPEPTPTPDPEQQPEPSPEPPPPQEDPEEPPPDEPPPPEDEDPFPWLILLLVLAAAGGLVFQIHRHMPDRMAARAATEQDKVYVYGNGVYIILRLLGREPKPGETPLRFARRMDSLHAAAEPILPLWRMMAMSNYSRRQPGPEQTLRAKAVFHAVYGRLSLISKLKFLLTIGFSPKRYHSLETAVVHEEPVSKTRLPGPKDGAGGKGKTKKTRKPRKPQTPQKAGARKPKAAKPPAPTKGVSGGKGKAPPRKRKGRSKGRR